MTAKVIMVLVVSNVLVTEAASASGTHSEADGCIVIPASGENEQIQSCSDSTSLLQAGVRTHSEEGGRVSEDSSSSDDDEEGRRRGRRRNTPRRRAPQRWWPCSMPEGIECDVKRQTEWLYSQKSFQGGRPLDEECWPHCASGLARSNDSSPVYAPWCRGDHNLVWHGGTRQPPFTCVKAAAKGKLTVTIVKASGLKDEDWGSDSDPYVIVKLNGNQCDSCRTATVDDDNNPSWNHEVSLDISNISDELTFAVYDEDSAARDDFLGEVPKQDVWLRNGFRNFLQQGGEKTYDFTLLVNSDDPSKTTDSGMLTVKLNFQA